MRTDRRGSGALVLVLAPLLALSCSSDAKGSDAGRGEATCPGRKAGPAQDRVEKVVPATNEVPGWAEDSAVGGPGVEAGYTYDEIVAIIDGSQEPYAQAGCSGFAKQDYRKGSFTLNLHIWEMKDSAAAKQMFDKDKADMLGEGITNGEAIPCVYDASVVGSDRTMLKGYVQKSQYLFKLVARCDSTDQVPQLKGEVLAFATSLAEKLP
jgi:hypothetical protein